MKAYRNDDFVEGAELPVRFNQLSEIRLMKYLIGKEKEKTHRNICKHYGISYAPGRNLRIIIEYCEVRLFNNNEP